MSNFGKGGLFGSNREKQFHRADSLSHSTNRLIEMLDHLERRVELFRKHATGLESERDSLLTILSTIQSNQELETLSEGEREEIELTAQRLMNRTLTVEVSVVTPRNELQQEALNNVNYFFDNLLCRMKEDLEGAKVLIHHYLNACLSDCKGTIDPKFQAAILGCTADDQKLIRKRLESLMVTISHSEQTSNS